MAEYVEVPIEVPSTAWVVNESVPLTPEGIEAVNPTAVDWHSALEVASGSATGVLVRPVGGSFRETIGYPAATHFVVHPDGGVTLYAGVLVAAAWARGEWAAVEHWAPTP